MKKVWKNALSVGMGIVLLFGSVACGGKTGTEGTKAPDNPPQGENGKQQLVVSVWDYSTTEYMKNQIKGFNKKFDKYDVKVLEYPANEYDDQVQIKLSGGDTMDVVFTKGTPALSGLIDKGQALPLDDYIKKAGVDEKKFSGLIKFMQSEGKTYAIPYRKDNWMIFYNKDLFDKAGVEYPKDGMTLEQFRELAKKMTSGEGSEKVYGAYNHIWTGCVTSYPIRIGEFEFMKTGFDPLIPYYKTFLAMANEDKSMMDYGAQKAGNIHYTGVFYNGEAAMVAIGSWFINMLVEQKTAGKINFNWGVCSLPNDKGEGNTTGVGGVTPVSINKKALNPDGAWDFINYVTGAEGAKMLAQNGVLPGYTDDAIVGEFAKLNGVPDNITDYLKLDKIYVQEPLLKNGRNLFKIFDEQHDLIMTNQVTPEEGLRELAERLEAEGAN